jgi:polyhydroxyalkanoate synthase
MTNAAAEPVGGGEAAGIPSLPGVAGGLALALSQGTTVAREAIRLTAELTRIARGHSSVAPAPGDRRFTDPAWTSNPGFRMIKQSYLASAEALGKIVTQLGDGRSDTTAERAGSRRTSWPAPPHRPTSWRAIRPLSSGPSTPAA